MSAPGPIPPSSDENNGDITVTRLPSRAHIDEDIPDVEAQQRRQRQDSSDSGGTLPKPGGGSSQAADDHTVLDPDEPAKVNSATWRELIKWWFILGWTAFGGPAAHVAMFQKLFVDKLRWCTMVVFTELLMLGQCMPGPTSTQMGFALGVLKKGLSGGLVSGILFQGPGLLILSILGWAASKVLNRNIHWLNGLVAGLAAAGIALIASASVALTRGICKGRLLQVIATTAAVIAYYYPKPWTFPALIVLGGLTTLIIKRKEIIDVKDVSVGVERLGFNKLGGALLILIWVAVLVTTVVIAGKQDYNSSRELHWFAAFYRTGSVIFGGGQVVLPMLYNDVVSAKCLDQQYRCCPTALAGNDTAVIQACRAGDAYANPSCQCSWMSGNEFYAGLALAQAMPGPLFNFAAYLGAVIAQNAGVFPIAGIALCWIALFAPGIMLIFAILPFWGSFRKWQIYRRYAGEACVKVCSASLHGRRIYLAWGTNAPCHEATITEVSLSLPVRCRALPGLNSSAVGLIITSVFQLTLTAYVSSPFPHTSICIGIIAFAATEVLVIPAPFVVVGGGVLGIIGWAAGMN